MSGFLLADIEGQTLSLDDKKILSHPHVVGVILFARNYVSKKQLLQLTTELRQIKPHFIIAVDQEGGRVQRFKHDFVAIPPQSFWGDLYRQDPLQAKTQLAQSTHNMTDELIQVGVNFNLVPVLDVDRGLNSVISNRSFANDPEIVIELAEVMINQLHELAFPVMAKHFPGHGSVLQDSHYDLPCDLQRMDELLAGDLKPFLQLLSKLDALMPAHILFSQIDSLPVTYSRFWLRNFLREQLMFQGVVISDDLSMSGAAAMGSYPERAKRALEAGCDMLTVCNNRAGLLEIIDSQLIQADAVSTQRVEKFMRMFN